MHEIEPCHRHVLNAALGWLELGNPAEAEAELGKLPPALQAHPQILELRWRVLCRTQRWDDALQVAETLIQADQENPAGWVNRSYCLHELRRTREAWESLLPAAQRFPLVPTVVYNLACYACQMNRHTLALQWLRKAVRLLGRDQVLRLVAEDDDLAPLRERIGEL